MLSHTDTLMCGQSSEQMNAKVRDLLCNPHSPHSNMMA